MITNIILNVGIEVELLALLLFLVQIHKEMCERKTLAPSGTWSNEDSRPRRRRLGRLSKRRRGRGR